MYFTPASNVNDDVTDAPLCIQSLKSIVCMAFSNEK